MAMKAEIKQKWIEALRSRKFKQTREALKKDLDGGKVGHCCLGVLHEITDGPWHRSSNWMREYETGAKQNKSSSDVYLKGKYAHGLTHPQCEQLAVLNDEKGWKFYQIANWIEKNIEVKN